MIELITNDRIVGGVTAECARRGAEVYRIFCKGEILITDADSAEMAKLVENSFRDVNIAFANELAEVCEHLGLDVWEIIQLANRHPRVQVLNPGPGVGGHCIAVDPWFIVSAAPEQARLIRAAREINDHRPLSVAHAAASVSKPDGIIAALGLAFKADIDDLRQSPAIDVVKRLSQLCPDASILAVEPHVHELPAELGKLGNVALSGLYKAVAEADVVVVLVDHAQFKGIPPEELRGKAVIDTRGILRQAVAGRILAQRGAS